MRKFTSNKKFNLNLNILWFGYFQIKYTIKQKFWLNSRVKINNKHRISTFFLCFQYFELSF